MKRIIALILALLLVFSMAACGKDTPDAPVTENPETESTESTTEPTPEVTECPHNFVADKTVDPTCEKEGYTLYICALCKETEERDKTEKLEHAYASQVTPPTTEKQGFTTHTCEVCGHSYEDNYTEKLPAGTEPVEHTHKFVDTVKAPTCTTEGYTTHKCAVCGSAYTDSRVPALGHKYTDTVVNPTCETQGYTQHKCDRCGHTTKDTYTNATGHAYSFTSDTATCTKAGTITETCGNCGKTKTANSPAKGHGETTTKVITEASCQKEGKTQTICTACNAVLSESTTPKGTCHYVTDTAGNAGNFCANSHIVEISSNAWISCWGNSVKVDVCYGCGSVKNPRIAYDGASESLGYVNALRRSVGVDYGVDLELDSACVALAQLRAKEIYTNYSHAGARAPSGFFTFGENITSNNTASPYQHYTQWLNSSGHYATMIDICWTHFGYGAYLPSDAIERGRETVTAVQIFAG